MNLLKQLPITIATCAALMGCDNLELEPAVPLPEQPEPLQPLPAEKISLEVGHSIIDAMKESVVITTLEGEEKRINVETFKGIEYATQTRFEHSIIKELEETIDATEFGDACMQIRATAQDQSEDCLNLNIWRPAGVEAGADLPVYVFIHGGDFEYGAGSEALVHGDTVVAQGGDDGKPFIYISLNYRLGQLGTQWVKGTNVDGNYGLGDQKRALEWVHDNIASFGGDIDNVTIMGQGSGAMSVGFLQQDENIAGNYFQRAIMQSNPYGFEYPSYDVAKDRSQEYTAETPIDEIIAHQKTALSGIEQLKNWLLSSLSLSISVPVPLVPEIEVGPKSDNTPMSTLMPFAPYIQCEQTNLISGACKESAPSPLQSKLTVPSVLGNNASEANSFGMLFSVTFLIPTVIELIANEAPDLVENVEPKTLAVNLIEWLDDEQNQAKVEQKLLQLDTDVLTKNAGLSLTAYGAVIQLFWGLDTFIDIDDAALDCLSEEDTLGIITCIVGSTSIDLTGHKEVKTTLNLTDFYPNSEADLGGATANMKQFKTLLNDTLFNGPARHMATNSDEAVALYSFDKKPSFNMWNYNTEQNEDTGEYGELSILDLFKTIGCISGACNGSELPFMFNKAMRFDGSEVHPNKREKTLMNEMSRLWFSEELFTQYQYSDVTDNVLVIEAEGFSESTTDDWDYVTNPGVDPKLRDGRLTGLEEQGIMPWQWYLN
ncbi:carboxylesterase family protein [Vibrio mediterranei]|uniref:carboxylesterase family protein n=1 Tax=Vibrio mediterranei TaxID=689 RepID=UPI0038CE934C